ncbi:uncharacterized protein B0H18DRAFT_691427 [Fomitopsis serialis]|uniref:uncharacterized protein n=1 Tax=Fomitopsis serialis TaxID=139415 RepID=UPI002007AF8B|nr:uncharacterized protein B0H18DRAFT_691427 [Neoantrodia serialis]KAH9917621.1 hypothetical protein B0H18DRAFT_691427 [Neoantrodia serialis]
MGWVCAVMHTSTGAQGPTCLAGESVSQVCCTRPPSSTAASRPRPMHPPESKSPTPKISESTGRSHLLMIGGPRGPDRPFSGSMNESPGSVDGAGCEPIPTRRLSANHRWPPPLQRAYGSLDELESAPALAAPRKLAAVSPLPPSLSGATLRCDAEDAGVGFCHLSPVWGGHSVWFKVRCSLPVARLDTSDQRHTQQVSRRTPRIPDSPPPHHRRRSIASAPSSISSSAVHVIGGPGSFE